MISLLLLFCGLLWCSRVCVCVFVLVHLNRFLFYRKIASLAHFCLQTSLCKMISIHSFIRWGSNFWIRLFFFQVYFDFVLCSTKLFFKYFAQLSTHLNWTENSWPNNWLRIWYRSVYFFLFFIFYIFSIYSFSISFVGSFVCSCVTMLTRFKQSKHLVLRVHLVSTGRQATADNGWKRKSREFKVA